MMTDLQQRQLERIAERWVALLRKYRTPPAAPERVISHTKAMIADWNEKEPLDFDVLENCSDQDFAHDVSGITGGDKYMSARSAAIYHQRRTSK